MITQNDIKKAAENFYIKKDELLNEILSSDLTKKKKSKKLSLPLRRAIAALAAAAILFAGCFTVYAMSPEFRSYINLWFMGSPRKDKVPEGYIGIYTIEDLDNIRNNLGGKYILMNDLTFSDSDFAEGGRFEGGWTAIGDNENPFTGEFDGNGHVISNITLKQGKTYTGLFGVSQFKKINDKYYSYYKSAYDGIIKNLGLNGVKANIEISVEDYYCIGSVIASGRYVTGCFAENVMFNIYFPDFQKEGPIENQQYSLKGALYIGGICGRAYIIDSCYADVDIKFHDVNNKLDEKYRNDFLLVGGVAGMSCNIVTSYYTGNISLNENAFGSGEVLNYNTIMPYVITEKRYNEINQKLTEKANINGGPNKDRDWKVFNAFYHKEPSHAIVRDLLMRSIDEYEEFYILEWQATKKEIMRLEAILLQVYDREEFKNGTLADSVKSGIDFCYTLEKGKAYDKSYFEHFDFENIWVMKDGVPKLRIFQ